MGLDRSKEVTAENVAAACAKPWADPGQMYDDIKSWANAKVNGEVEPEPEATENAQLEGDEPEIEADLEEVSPDPALG